MNVQGLFPAETGSISADKVEKAKNNSSIFAGVIPAHVFTKPYF